jgi:hypothetical protein
MFAPQRGEPSERQLSKNMRRIRHSLSEQHYHLLQCLETSDSNLHNFALAHVRRMTTTGMV